MLEYIVQGCSAAGTRRNGVPTPFFTICFKMSLKLFPNGYFLDAFPHLFVSTTSLTWFDFHLLIGRID